MMLSEQIGTAAHQVLEKTPPELAGDIYRNGVMLTGGGAQLHGLTEYLSQELKVEVTVSPDPVNCVALGTAQSLWRPALWTQRPASAAGKPDRPQQRKRRTRFIHAPE